MVARLPGGSCLFGMSSRPLWESREREEVKEFVRLGLQAFGGLGEPLLPGPVPPREGALQAASLLGHAGPVFRESPAGPAEAWALVPPLWPSCDLRPVLPATCCPRPSPLRCPQCPLVEVRVEGETGLRLACRHLLPGGQGLWTAALSRSRPGIPALVGGCGTDSLGTSCSEVKGPVVCSGNVVSHVLCSESRVSYSWVLSGCESVMRGREGPLLGVSSPSQGSRGPCGVGVAGPPVPAWTCCPPGL